MNISHYSRSQLLHHALNASGASLVHQMGPWKGKPLGIKKINAMITSYVRDQKSRGLLMERRPLVDVKANRRKAQYVFIPQTLDIFIANPGSDPNQYA